MATSSANLEMVGQVDPSRDTVNALVSAIRSGDDVACQTQIASLLVVGVFMGAGRLFKRRFRCWNGLLWPMRYGRQTTWHHA